MKRITISITDVMQEWMEENIKKKKFHNYQHAIEYCIYQEMTHDKKEV